MRKLMVLVLGAFLVGMMVPGFCSAAQQFNLLTDGRDSQAVVGTVDVSNNATTLFFDFAMTSEDWLFSEIHIQVSATDPMSPGGKQAFHLTGGGPKVGQFDVKIPYCPFTDAPDQISMPLPAGSPLYIAIHTEIAQDENEDCIADDLNADTIPDPESAWAISGITDGVPQMPLPGKNWATYVVYTPTS